MLTEFCPHKEVLTRIAARCARTARELEPIEEYMPPQQAYRVFSEQAEEQCLVLSFAPNEIETVFLPLMEGLGRRRTVFVYLLLGAELPPTVKLLLEPLPALVHFSFTTLQPGRGSDRRLTCYVGFAKPQSESLYDTDYSIRILDGFQRPARAGGKT